MRDIVLWPSPTLKEISKETTLEEAKALVPEMWEVLKEANGLGLSAIQIGVPIRLFIMDSRNPWKSRHAFINPEIVETIGDLQEVTEGCLSIPGYFEKTMRYPEVVIRAIDIEHDVEPRLYQLAGTEAQCALHEMEHFEGKLFIDGYGRVKKDIVKRKMQKYLREKGR